MGRALLGLSTSQGFGTLVDNRAVPIGLTQHGQTEGNEVFTGIRGMVLISCLRVQQKDDLISDYNSDDLMLSTGHEIFFIHGKKLMALANDLYARCMQ